MIAIHLKQVTLRLPPEGHRRLREICTEFGVSIGAFFEAAAIQYFELFKDHPVTPELWEVCRRLQAEGAFSETPEQPREKVVFRMDSQLADKVRAEARLQGVTQNVCFGIVVMPWPEDVSLALAALADLQADTVLAIARRIDVERRGGNLEL